ncbi:XdhC/CoxI family protein [Christensenellaceae bacterium OttesenSCG-928-M15]|nr:XdhC/CoxI family protein [Christensenellaceae bacterium OttesenSCG-928-M15]
MNHLSLLEELLEALRQNKGCAVVTIIATEGSVSRSEGKMLVYADGSVSGTIGGGMMERSAIADAINCICENKNGCFQYSRAGESAKQEQGSVCGDGMQVLIEVFQPRSMLYLCGGGHVGTALIPLAQAVGYTVTLIDTRTEDEIPAAVKQADRFVRVAQFEEGLLAQDIAPGACFVISTYGHAQDGEALYAALQKQAAYIGMVGSVKKREALFARLLTRGVPQARLYDVFTPVGLDLGGETPAEIAISIMAEIMQVVHGRTGMHAKGV